jgi:glycosyltransferase involved in cell wall biosynthesis
LARIGINPEKCSVVYCGLDHDLYRPGQAKTQNPTLIYLGRLMNYKRVDLLIKLMVPVVEEYPDAVLHIVGSGPAENESRQMVKQHKLDDHVIFHGRVSEADKVSLLQQSWLLVVASMKEGWGLVAIEANACGTPAIAFNVSGLCEAIDNPHSGLLADSEEDFVKKIVLLLRHDDLRARMSQSAQKHAGNFVWDKTAAQTLAILYQTVEGKKRAIVSSIQD